VNTPSRNVMLLLCPSVNIELATFANMSEKTSLTIAAPATPLGISALAVIRVSGSEVCNVVSALFARTWESLPMRGMVHAQAKDPETFELIDDLLFCVFPGPHSFTGEDVLEIFPHGNPLLVRRLLEVICKLPYVRLAEPGEFTRRAFEAGKVDLVQAEAIGQLLHATVDSSLRNAQKLLQGHLSTHITTLTNSVTHLSALLELDVDFAEEEADADIQNWSGQLCVIEQQLQKLAQNFRSAAAENRTPSIVFYGAPNAGKSSLVNALLRDDRLLVSPKAGTTRDVVEVLLLLKGGEVRLVDTAGLSATPIDELDAASQVKALERIGRADISLCLIDSSQPLDGLAQQSILNAKQQGHWIVYTKIDIGAEVSGMLCVSSVSDTLSVSSHTGAGLDVLMQRMSDALFSEPASQEEFWISSERQQGQIKLAIEGVQRARNLLAQGRNAPEELAFEMRFVRDHLVGITGQISTDEILDTIFQKFCIGK